MSLAGRRLRALAGELWPHLQRPGYFRTLYWVYIVAALAILTFLIPPFQKADEPAHYHRALSLTYLDFTCKQDDQGQYYFNLQRRYTDLPDLLHVFDVAFIYEAKFDWDWLDIDFSDPVFDEQARIYRFCSLPPAGYLPNALGVLLGRPFENPMPGFYLGRLFGALFFLGAILLALRVVPARYRLIVYFYAAIPMVLHQVGALSYDAVQLSLFPLVFAYLTRFLVEQGPIRPRDLAVFALLLLWLNSIRLISYLPFMLVFFSIQPSRIADRFSRYLLVAGFFAVAALLLTSVLGSVYLPTTEDSAPEGQGIDTDLQVQFVLHHPWQFVEACYKTLHVSGDLLLRELIFVGGWIDYGTNYAFYYSVVFLAGAFIWYFASREPPALRWYQLGAIAGAIGLTSLMLFFSLYVVWSPVGADAVSGLQGRYFVGLLPFTVLAIGQLTGLLGRERLLRLLALVLLLFLLYQLYRAVHLRYY